MLVLNLNLFYFILDTNKLLFDSNMCYFYLFLKLVSFKCICATLIPIRSTLTIENLIINIAC